MVGLIGHLDRVRGGHILGIAWYLMRPGDGCRANMRLRTKSSGPRHWVRRLTVRLWHRLVHHVLRDHWGGIHLLRVVRELGSVGVLLGVGVSDSLIEGAPHGNVVGEVGSQASIEVGPVLKVRCETSVLQG